MANDETAYLEFRIAATALLSPQQVNTWLAADPGIAIEGLIKGRNLARELNTQQAMEILLSLKKILAPSEPAPDAVPATTIKLQFVSLIRLTGNEVGEWFTRDPERALEATDLAAGKLPPEMDISRAFALMDSLQTHLQQTGIIAVNKTQPLPFESVDGKALLIEDVSGGEDAIQRHTLDIDRASYPMVRLCGYMRDKGVSELNSDALGEILNQEGFYMPLAARNALYMALMRTRRDLSRVFKRECLTNSRRGYWTIAPGFRLSIEGKIINTPKRMLGNQRRDDVQPR